MTIVTLYLIGPADLGKHTIAHTLGLHNYKVVDNHLLDTPILSLVTRSSGSPIPDNAWMAIRNIRQTVLDFMAQDTRANYVLTNSLHDTEYDHYLYAEVKKAAELRHSLFIPVLITQANTQDAIASLPIQHPNLQRLDLTTLSPTEAANTLLTFVQALLHTAATTVPDPLPLDHVFIVEGGDARVDSQIWEGLKSFNAAQVGPYQRSTFTLYMQNEDGTVIAGVTGSVLQTLGAVSQTWVQEHYRNQNLGTKLFEALEAYVKTKGCTILQLETEDFQAKDFYEKIGFSAIAHFDSHRYPEHTQYVMRKKL